MNADHSVSPGPDQEMDIDDEEDIVNNMPGPRNIIAAAQQQAQAHTEPRNRSPTPPRALFRSTTGKGVAFTQEDVTFLIRFMEYRK